MVQFHPYIPNLYLQNDTYFPDIEEPWTPWPIPYFPSDVPNTWYPNSPTLNSSSSKTSSSCVWCSPSTPPSPVPKPGTSESNLTPPYTLPSLTTLGQSPKLPDSNFYKVLYPLRCLQFHHHYLERPPSCHSNWSPCFAHFNSERHLGRN